MATVAIVGAGIAGLACGRRLQAAGHQVTWLEKSRGVGGRLATRRLDQGWVDHGVRYWAPQHPELQALNQLKLLQLWQAEGFRWQGQLQPHTSVAYCTERGVNAIAKYLATGCHILRQHRVVGLAACTEGWLLRAEGPNGPTTFTVSAVIIAIPAPQAAVLLATLLPASVTAALERVRYAPCLSLIATYDRLPLSPPLDHQRGWHITIPASQTFTSPATPVWISLDSSKPSGSYVGAPFTVLMQSQALFASHYLQQIDSCQGSADRLTLQTARHMLAAAAAVIPQLDRAEWHRLHRWRYSMVEQPYPGACLAVAPNLLCCGDWCHSEGYENIDAAHHSGTVAAQTLLSALSA